MSQPFDKYEKLGAYHWDWYDDPNYIWYKECADKVIDFCQGSTIDVGCGEGFIIAKLEDKGFDCVGLDNNQEALRLAYLTMLSTQEIDLNKPINGWKPYRNYDYMCSLNTIEHLETADTLKEIIEFVDKGAIIITDKPTGNPGRYHEHEYTKQELLEVFKEFKPKYFEINSTEFGKPVGFHGVEITK